MANFNLQVLKRQGEEAAKEGSCTPVDKPDPETGCRACGVNSYNDYQQCRQSFYLRQQTKITENSIENKEINSGSKNENLKSEVIEYELTNNEHQSIPDQNFYSNSMILITIFFAIVIGFLIGFVISRFTRK